MSGTSYKRLSRIFFIFLISSVCFSKSEIHTDRTGTKPLVAPGSEVSFPFVILGDRTTGQTDGLGVLRQAIDEINLLRPDFVITIGDMVEGYNAQELWEKQAEEYLAVMKHLNVPWFPTAGNHDMLLAGVGHGFNHSGDGGIWGSIVDPAGKVMTRKFFKSEKLEWMYCMAADSVKYRIVLEDQDAEFTGPNPGNGGTIQVYVKPMDK